MTLKPDKQKMKLPSALLLAACLVGFSLAIGSPQMAYGEKAEASNVVVVHLTSGQKLKAAVDIRSDKQMLWLRFDRPTAVLYRPVAWSHVLRVDVDGQTHGADAFRDIAAQHASAREFKRVARRATPNDHVTHATTETTLARQALAEKLHVAAVSIDAGVANWDRDPEIDGVVLYVSALNEAGEAVPARGTLSIELVSDRRSHLRPLPLTRRERFGRFGQWTRNLVPADSGEAVYLLPFQAVHPEFDRAIDSFGMLHVKLAVPGDGVFEATVSDLRIRPLSHYRNRLEASRGTRFLDTERTGRGKQFGI